MPSATSLECFEDLTHNEWKGIWSPIFANISFNFLNNPIKSLLLLSLVFQEKKKKTEKRTRRRRMWGEGEKKKLIEIKQLG